MCVICSVCCYLAAMLQGDEVVFVGDGDGLRGPVHAPAGAHQVVIRSPEELKVEEGKGMN